MREINSKSQMKRIAALDPVKAADELMRVKAERDRYREALEFVHKAMAWEERRCGKLFGVLGSAIERTRATLSPDVACLCGEINARHCPAHADVASPVVAGETMVTLRHDAFIKMENELNELRERVAIPDRDNGSQGGGNMADKV